MLIAGGNGDGWNRWMSDQEGEEGFAIAFVLGVGFKKWHLVEPTVTSLRALCLFLLVSAEVFDVEKRARYRPH